MNNLMSSQFNYTIIIIITKTTIIITIYLKNNKLRGPSTA